MAKIFLSYSKRDLVLAEQVAQCLRAEGLTVWWDKEITPREGWDRAIEREIAAADHVLALWTRNSVESDWVRIEANYARNCRPSKLVQARFDESEVPIAFSMIQFVDLDRECPPQSAEWSRLVGWLQESAAGCAGHSAHDVRAEQPAAAPEPASEARATPEPLSPLLRLGPRDKLLFTGPLLYFAGLAFFMALEAGSPREDYDLFGLPPALYVTFLFGVPFLLTRKLTLIEMLFFAVGIPAAHCAAQGAAYGVFHLLSDGERSFELMFLAGAVGGLVGSVLSFGMLVLTQPASPNAYARRQVAIAILFLPLVGGAGLHFATAAGPESPLSWALLFLPWQVIFLLYLLKVLNSAGPQRAETATDGFPEPRL